MHNRIRGDLVRSSWYQDRRTAACMCVYVCGLCNRISCYLVWYSWCTGLNWTGLSWAEAGQRGAMCVCVCESVYVCGGVCGGMYNRIRYYLVRCSWCWALASCSVRLTASACHWLPSFWTTSSCCLQPTSSELSLSTSCPAEMERQWEEEVSKSSKRTLLVLSEKTSNGD